MYLDLIGLSSILSCAFAGSSGHRDLGMRGDRFGPLSYDEMTPEQKKMTDHILSGQRGSMHGPYNVLLRSPEMGDLAQKFGAHMRFHSSLATRLNELAILLTAKHWESPFVWHVHRKFGINAGLDPVAVAKLAMGDAAGLAYDEKVIYEFSKELLETHRVSDATFDDAKKAFGERGIVDLMGVIGYYQFVSMLLNVDRYPLPEGESDQLQHAK